LDLAVSLPGVPVRMRPGQTNSETNQTYEIMKIAKIVLLAAAAAGSFLAASCCESAPAPAAPKYVAPAK
jgi:hypothetical protein